MTRCWPCIVVATLCLLALTSSASAEEPKGFLEWPWGTPQETITKRFSTSVQCRWSGKVGFCNKYYVRDVQVGELNLSFLPNGTLTGYYMFFTPDSYLKMRITITEKFGAPTKVSPTKSATDASGLAWEWPSGTRAVFSQVCALPVSPSAEPWRGPCLFVWSKSLDEWLIKEEEAANERRKKAF
jgi:hypothetical protein